MTDRKASPSNAKFPTAKPRRPRPITAQRLANIAAQYLDRYATSRENLRRVLQRRVLKAAYVHEDTDVALANGWIDDLIARYEDAGVLNDRSYGEGRARTLMARGTAHRVIRLRLQEKGLDPDTIDHALNSLQDEHPEPELAAAIKLARRRRLGPYRAPDTRGEKQDRDLAAMARAGFSYDMARRVIECEDVQDLEDWLHQRP